MKLQIEQQGRWVDLGEFTRDQIDQMTKTAELLGPTVGAAFLSFVSRPSGFRFRMVDDQVAAIVDAEEVERRVLKERLAYSAARSDIELICRQSATGAAGGSHWYSVKGYDDEDFAHLNRAMRYLLLIGKLNFDPDDTSLVCVIDMEGV